MNHALTPLVVRTTLPTRTGAEHEVRSRRVRSLLALFSLYAVALVAVLALPDAADIGCILAGVAGHVLYATARTVTSWRDASWLDQARERASVRAVA
jgi:hypothetical protein